MKELMKLHFTGLGVLEERVLNRAAEKWRSGAIDTSSVTEDDLTPLKALVYVCLREEADNWRPLSPEGRAIVMNLEHF